jgi:methanethiol S-methyltransferase
MIGIFPLKSFKMKTLVILWLLFFISHSFFAATGVKNYFAKTIGNAFKYYRFAYSLLSLILLVLIIGQLFLSESDIIFNGNTVTQVVGITLLLAGLYIMYSVFLKIDFFSFIGMSARDESPSGLITEGWYKVVRHPLYWGTLLFLMGIFFLKPTFMVFVSVVLSVIYIIIGIEFEEKKLRENLGKPYIDYAFNKKKFIPFVY